VTARPAHRYEVDEAVISDVAGLVDGRAAAVGRDAFSGQPDSSASGLAESHEDRACALSRMCRRRVGAVLSVLPREAAARAVAPMPTIGSGAT
jgi:hypothetical protein